MWFKAVWIGRPIRLELTRQGLLVELANQYTTRGAQAQKSAKYIKLSHVSHLSSLRVK